MPINGIIEDGQGTGTTAKVTERRAVLVQLVPDTSIGIATEVLTAIRLQREYFTDSLASENMNIDGATAPTAFNVSSEAGFTKWITGFRINMEGTDLEIATNDFRRFGATGPQPLTNGVEIFSFQSGEEIPIAIEPVTTIGEFLNYSDDFLSLVNSVGSQEDFLQFTFVLDKPIVLPSDSGDRITIRINDDLTAIDKFVAIARGYKEAA